LEIPAHVLFLPSENYPRTQAADAQIADFTGIGAHDSFSLQMSCAALHLSFACNKAVPS
jgi:hypothetical protein